MRGANKLTAVRVAKLTKPGRYGDGEGLWLQVSKMGTKAWLFRFALNGNARQMGLGPVHTISLVEARERAREARKHLLDGRDPIEARNASRAAARADAAKIVTFKVAAERYLASHHAGWRNAKHAAQWKATLATYAEPVIGNLSVATIDTALVTKILEPIWTTKAETASRVRGRIEAVLDWAKARGYRQGENPARWRGHLDKLLPATSKVRRVKHHEALPLDELPGFMARLREQAGVGARALEFAILTAARTGETIGATWHEIDLRARVWTIPAERMKADREHRVPLSERAMDLLKGVHPDERDGFVFPGGRRGKPLSNMALLKTLERMDRADLTTHGFRSTFRDWVSERTNFPRELAEMALAHVVGSKVEAAYARSDLFDKRRRLMDAWADACSALPSDKTANVVPLHATGG